MRQQTEHQLQKAVAAYLDRALPPDAFWTSIDSAGRGPIQGARMKARGVKRGLPDILVIWRGITIWIELKSAAGRLTGEQKRFGDLAWEAGHRHLVCRSLEAVSRELGGRIPLRCKVAA